MSSVYTSNRMTQIAEKLLTPEYDELIDTVIQSVSKMLCLEAAKPLSRSIVDLSENHGVHPIIIEAHKRKYISLNEQDVHDIRDRAVRSTMHRLKMFSVLTELTHIFKECSIPFLLLKGLALEALYYPPGMTRTQSDIDLMVSSDQIDEAVQILLTHPGSGLNAKARIVSKSSHAVTLFYEGVAIDLHTLLLEDRYELIDMWEKLYMRSQVIHQEWGSASTLSDEDAFHYMIAHSSKHQWCRLKWVLDLVWFIESQSPETLHAYVMSLYRTSYRKAGAIGIGLAMPYLGASRAELMKHYLPKSYVQKLLLRSYNRNMLVLRSGVFAKAANILRTILTSDSPYIAFKYLLKTSSRQK